VKALSIGRKAYTLLNSAAKGSPSAVIQLSDTLNAAAQHASELHASQSHHAAVRNPPRQQKLKKIAHLEDKRSKFWAERIPNPVPILERPVPQHALPDPSKPRKVPKLMSAFNTPFLQYKSGPQSPILSRIIQQHGRRDQKKWDLEMRLREEIDHAHLEDNWDRIVFEHTRYRDAGDADTNDRGLVITDKDMKPLFGKEAAAAPLLPAAKSWAEEVKVQLQDVQRSITDDSTKREAMSKKMWDIVVQERQLAEKEKLERREMRRKEREQLKRLECKDEVVAMTAIATAATS